MRLRLRPLYIVATVAGILCGQIGYSQTTGSANPLSADLQAAYKEAAGKNYDAAIASFRKGLAVQPTNAGAHKDFAYTLLKTGETVEARDEFATAMRLNPADETAALEFAFLAYETQKPIEARRTFNRLRKSSQEGTRATAEAAFQNIDKPLAEGIARWKAALKAAPNADTLAMYSAHWELGQLAELRDELVLAAEQYEICRKLKPNLSELLMVLARVWAASNRTEDAHAALLAASRAKDSRSAELALEKLGPRYPYPYEFVNALKLDESNTALRKELGYLYLAMGKPEDAKAEFKHVLEIDGRDQASIDQLSELNGFHRRTPAPAAVAAPVAPAAKAAAPEKVDARTMGLKSLALGYSRDAIKYLRQAHEEHPDDAEVMMKLGFAYNLAHDDADAIPWFDRARHSSDELIAAQSNKAYHNLRGDVGAQTTVWLQPFFSTRRSDLVGYGQVKRTVPLPFLNHNFSLYLSNRFDGDMRGKLQTAYGPSFLSDSASILAGGIGLRPWHHFTAYAEAGEAFKYMPGRRDKMRPDYRGGLDYARFFGAPLSGASNGPFLETSAGAHYINRYDKDWTFGVQNSAGYTFHLFGETATQVLVNGFYTRDAKREYWANTAEFGPGLKLHAPWMPSHMNFTTDFLRGVYLAGPYVDGNLHSHSSYTDIRIGFWYAFTK